MSVIVMYRRDPGAGSCPVSTLRELTDKVEEYVEHQGRMPEGHNYVSVIINGHTFVLSKLRGS